VTEQDPAATAEELTRRRWFLRLGEMAALAGISGLVPEIAAGLLCAEQEQAELPLGLHVASAPHLMQALSAHSPGSEGDHAQPGSSPFQPRFFSQEEFRIVTRLVEIVLGKVDPGAFAQTTQWLDLCFHSASEVREAAQHLDPLHRALAVAYYGEAPVRDLETADPQAVARDGMVALRQLSVEKYGRGFLELSEPQQIELVGLRATSRSNRAVQNLFEITRREAIRGYYTSAAGLRELNYKGNAYYLDCPGCGVTPRSNAP
jgi:Gluconate 2-dehydrogenase subunit 3